MGLPVSSNLPLIVARGSPFEMGVQHGSQCSDLIRAYPDTLLETVNQEVRLRGVALPHGQLRRDSLLRRAAMFLPQIEAAAPRLVEEMHGIAAGARCDMEEVLLVNIRAEVLGLHAGEEACTAFSIGRQVTAEGVFLSGQNLDQNPAKSKGLIMLRLEPDHGPAMLMCTFAGLVGYSGINSMGLTLFQNAISNGAWRPGGVPQPLLKRLLLEQADISGCLDVLERTVVSSSCNYLITDRQQAADFEVTPGGYARIDPREDVLVHTNHFLDDRFSGPDVLLADLPDSVARLLRMSNMVERRRGHVELADIKRMLADHAGHPSSICRHENGMSTIASIIAEPDSGRIHVALGNPCTRDYATYSL